MSTLFFQILSKQWSRPLDINVDDLEGILELLTDNELLSFTKHFLEPMVANKEE